MSTVCKLVTEGNNTLDFLVGDTPPNDLVGTILKKIWFLPKEILDLR